jgi:hypothetical protein
METDEGEEKEDHQGVMVKKDGKLEKHIQTTGDVTRVRDTRPDYCPLQRSRDYCTHVNCSPCHDHQKFALTSAMNGRTKDRIDTGPMEAWPVYFVRSSTPSQEASRDDTSSTVSTWWPLLRPFAVQRLDLVATQDATRALVTISYAPQFHSSVSCNSPSS